MTAAHRLDATPRDATVGRTDASVLGAGLPGDVSAADGGRAHELDRALGAWLGAAGSVAVGFSGGVDSAYLACAARDALGERGVVAVIGRSASYPAEQWERARAIAERFAIRVVEIDTDELHDPSYAANPSNRCYFCKTELWRRVVPVAAAQGMAVVVDGTNADDVGGHRPGARAANEQGVRSPLAELGFTKDDVRAASRARGLPSWSQPSSPCLASRIPYGTPVTAERLRRIERAEAALRALGATGDLRVRDHGDVARVEVEAAQIAEWLAPGRAAALADAVRGAGFARAALDLRGFRSGSLNVLGGVAVE